MKKILGVLICLLTIFGCSKEVKSFELEEKYYGKSDIVMLENYSELKTLVDEKESIVLYVYLAGCIVCQSYRPKIEEAVEKEHITIYEISIENYKKVSKNTVKFAPSLVMINEGKVVAYLDMDNENHNVYYESVDGIISYIDKYIIKK